MQSRPRNRLGGSRSGVRPDRPSGSHIDAISLMTLDGQVAVMFVRRWIGTVGGGGTLLGAFPGATPTGGRRLGSSRSLVIPSGYVVKQRLVRGRATIMRMRFGVGMGIVILRRGVRLLRGGLVGSRRADCDTSSSVRSIGLHRAIGGRSGGGGLAADDRRRRTGRSGGGHHDQSEKERRREGERERRGRRRKREKKRRRIND